MGYLLSAKSSPAHKSPTVRSTSILISGEGYMNLWILTQENTPQTTVACNRASLTNVMLRHCSQTQKHTFHFYEIPKQAKPFFCLEIGIEVTLRWELLLGSRVGSRLEAKECPGSGSGLWIQDVHACKSALGGTLRPAYSCNSVKYTNTGVNAWRN